MEHKKLKEAIGWIMTGIVSYFIWRYLYADASTFSKVLGVLLSLFLGALCTSFNWVWLDREEAVLRNKQMKEEFIQEIREEARRKEQEKIDSIVEKCRTRFEYFSACHCCRSTNKALLFQHEPPEGIALALEKVRIAYIVSNDASAEAEVICLDCKHKIWRWSPMQDQDHFENSQPSFILIAKYRGKNPLRPHSEYRAWLKKEFGMDVSFVLPEVDPDRLRAGDIVVGTLAVPDMAKVVECGCRYFHVAWKTPPAKSCWNITRRDIEKGNPDIREYHVMQIEGRGQ